MYSWSLRSTGYCKLRLLYIAPATLGIGSFRECAFSFIGIDVEQRSMSSATHLAQESSSISVGTNSRRYRITRSKRRTGPIVTRPRRYDLMCSCRYLWLASLTQWLIVSLFRHRRTDHPSTANVLAPRLSESNLFCSNLLAWESGFSKIQRRLNEVK
jgi:hypothetical protein